MQQISKKQRLVYTFGGRPSSSGVSSDDDQAPRSSMRAHIASSSSQAHQQPSTSYSVEELNVGHLRFHRQVAQSVAPNSRTIATQTTNSPPIENFTIPLNNYYRFEGRNVFIGRLKFTSVDEIPADKMRNLLATLFRLDEMPARLEKLRCPECRHEFQIYGKNRHHFITHHMGMRYKCPHPGCAMKFKTASQAIQYHLVQKHDWSSEEIRMKSKKDDCVYFVANANN